MRPLLYTTPVLAWPPDQGSKRFLLESARALQTLGPVTWLTRSIGGQSEARMRLRDEGFELLLDEDFVDQRPWRRAWRRAGIDLRALRRGVMREEEFVCTPRVLSLARRWWRDNPRGLGVSAYWSASRALECAPRGSRVLLAPDVESHCMELARGCGASAYRQTAHEKLRRSEARAFGRADLVAFLTQDDRDAAGQLEPSLDRDRTAIWPTFIPLPEAAEEARASSPGNARLLIYGHWEADFNRDGLEWFLDDLWSGLSQRHPSATLRVVGRGLPASDRRGHNVEFVGFVEDLEAELARSDVVLLPLRFAGGMRYRLLEALSHGAAVIATPMAARGSLATAGQHYLEATTVDEWSRALDDLRDAARRHELGRRGREWVSATHGTTDRAARVRRALGPLLVSKEGDDA